MLDCYLQVKVSSKIDGVHRVHNCVQSIVAHPHSLHRTSYHYRAEIWACCVQSARGVLSNRQLCDAPHKKSIRISL